ncbi:MAG: prepilin-type N-terminal cleavage/methylation domain-containing protein [Opitutaceae bacterium]|jgi:prepilin-type N-terminal cleavage/methylation domain-containing protein|nr:prepilin-type N-terminal cleavage/methylation domain-containing protein [Opitutaceae bacterium]
MTSPNVHRDGDSRAFTLIELLTVIAIIGILAAIVLSTVGTVRKAAREVRSVSNLRQIALAMNTYANDNKDLFPPGYYYKQGESELYWTSELVPYIGLPKKVLSARGSLYVSPLALLPVKDNTTGNAMPSTYSVHGILCSNTSDGDNRLPRSQVARPSQVILVGEAAQRSNTWTFATFSEPSEFQNRGSTKALTAFVPTDSDVDEQDRRGLRYRGRNGAPVAMVDGHAVVLKKGAVTYGNLVADR